MVAALGIFVSSVTSTLYRWTTSGKYPKTACLEVLTASRLRRGQIAHICSVRSWDSCLDIQRSDKCDAEGSSGEQVISRTEFYTVVARVQCTQWIDRFGIKYNHIVFEMKRYKPLTYLYG